MFNRSTEIAISAMSRLVEAREKGQGALTAAQVAQDRGIPKPFVAKVLTVLSQRGLVVGSPGRRGGYSLALPPEQISLRRIAECFERFDRPTPCPFGPGNCGGETKCPLHDRLSALQGELLGFLGETSLAVFIRGEAGAPGEAPGRPAR